MSVVELLTEARALSQADRLQLIQQMAEELRLEQMIVPGATYEIWSPYEAYEAAAIMMKALEEERNKA